MITFCSEEFGEVNIDEIPCSKPPKVIESFFETVKVVMELPHLEMRFISNIMAKRYNPYLKKIGMIGWGNWERQLICVVESEGGASDRDPINVTKEVILHEAVHAKGYDHGKKCDDVEKYYKILLL